MFSIFTRKKVNPDAIVDELWETSFKWYQKNRFDLEDTDQYFSRVTASGFALELKKNNLFAWSNSRLFRYRDFHLEAKLSLAGSNGYSAAGIIFHYANEENFYYFLVSSRGAFRCDVVFNANPIHLVEWTECPLIKEGEMDLRIIAHGSFYSFYIDDEWVAEFDDDTIPAGRLGLAAQNYNESENAIFNLKRFKVDSRPLQVETAYYRWVHYIPVLPEYRRKLAETFFSMGRFTAAVVQLKKALRAGGESAELHFQLAASFLHLKLYDEALESIEKSLALEPAKSEAVIEKANILYLINEFVRGRAYIKKIMPSNKKNPMLWNLLGNNEFALKNWQAARKAYRKAISLEGQFPIYLINAGRAAREMGEGKEALDLYLQASRLLFKLEDYTEIYLLLPQVKRLDPENCEVIALEGKMLFHEQKFVEAEKLFAGLIHSGYKESSVFFLYGLILAAEDNRAAALKYLEQATRLEPDYYLYWFHLAEKLFLSGKDPMAALKKAIDLAPDDPWVNNLYGLVLLRNGPLSDAGSYLQKALDQAPAERYILINFSEYLFRTEQREKAFSVIGEGLKAAGDHPQLLNHRGNLFSRLKKYREAAADYEIALKADPDNLKYMENCAACSIELDMIMRAEELLLKLLEKSPGVSVYNRLGNLALIKREYKRAELAFKEALKLEPDNGEINLNLAALYLQQGRHKQAKELTLSILEKQPDSAGAEKLLSQIRKNYEQKIQCASCSREWWVPRELPPQRGLKLRGEPPGEAPAGKCPACGKIYCIACASDHLRDKRFICADCGEFLKLSGDQLKYLIAEHIA
ncbi:MAG: tetratricopeptide repeat protein [Spirochaeta sp.]|nr:tetratricopeptide repeat protein [Spirochaeta sp.]